MSQSSYYAPPPKSPSDPQSQHFLPPPGPPPTAPYTAQSPVMYAGIDTPPHDEPPPAYTRNATDHLPAWSSIEFTDLTASGSPSDLARLPLDPPPSCFSTPTPPRIRTHSFESFRIPSYDQSLLGGFQLLYRHGQLSPHGISAEDWKRFLQDLGIAARLSTQGLSMRGNVQPPRAGFIRGKMGTAYDASFAKTPVEEVQELISIWNQSAFERRKVRVTLHPRTDVQARRREAYELLVEAL